MSWKEGKKPFTLNIEFLKFNLVFITTIYFESNLILLLDHNETPPPLHLALFIQSIYERERERE